MPQEKRDVRSILPIDVEEKKKKPKAKREDGKSAEESLRLGDERLAEGEVNDAIHHYRRALRQDDTSVETRLRLADSYDLAELGPQAAAQYEKLLKGKKQRPEAHVGLADVYRRYGKHRAGILRLKKACQLNPSNAFYWFRLAEAIVAAGVAEDAELPATRAFEAEPNDPFYGVWLGRLLLKLNKSKEAVKPLETAARLNPEDHEVWFLAAAALSASKQKDRANRAITRASDLDPDNLLYKACRIALEGGEEKVILSAYDMPNFEKWLDWAGIA
jgi:tetratricopeptide (TPR) repeat protein